MELIGKMSRPSATTRKHTCKTMLACPHHHANKYAPLYISNSSYGRKLCFAFRLQVLLLSFLYNAPTVRGSTTFPQTIRNYFSDNRLKFEPRWPISLIFQLLWMVLFYCWRIFSRKFGFGWDHLTGFERNRIQWRSVFSTWLLWLDALFFCRPVSLNAFDTDLHNVMHFWR